MTTWESCFSIQKLLTSEEGVRRESTTGPYASTFVQEARQLDVNIVSQIDVLAVKELSDLSSGFEGPQFRGVPDKARAAFQTVLGDRRQWAWVYSEPANFGGLVRSQLPSFWSTV